MQNAKIAGKYIGTLEVVAAGWKYGMVVTPDAHYMALSFSEENKLRVYRIEADVTATLLHTFGGEGAGPMLFSRPYKMCLAANGNLLVCDRNNDRVQELTGPGEEEPVHVRDLKVHKARTIATHGDMIAVGTGSAVVVLLCYATGSVIRTFGSEGTGRGHIGSMTEGLRFTSNGRSILAASYKNKRVPKFRVSDCELDYFCCVGQVSDGHKDVEILPTGSGDVIVADCWANRICVFSADGRTLLRTWGTEGTADGQFRNPTALALVGNKLFVLDCDSPRVQVFE